MAWPALSRTNRPKSLDGEWRWCVARPLDLACTNTVQQPSGPAPSGSQPLCKASPMLPDTLLAFVGHAPALMLFRRWRFPRGLLIVNAIAMALTLLVMVVVGHWSGWPALLLVWALGHMSWGATLVVLMRQGRAGGPQDA